MKDKETKIKEQIDLFEKIKGVKLNEEEIEYVRKQFENPIAKDIELRDAEVDIRELSDKDFKQLVYREFRDMNLRLKFLQEINNELVMALYVLIKAQGKNPFSEIENMTNEAMEKLGNGEFNKD